MDSLDSQTEGETDDPIRRWYTKMEYRNLQILRCVVPWGVQSSEHGGIDFWQGRLGSDLVDQAVATLVEELQ